MQNQAVIQSIATHLYNLFVVNSNVIGLQMPDGKYIPQINSYTSSIFETMLNKKISLGIYQQQYYRNVTKWICLDFDCKLKEKDPSEILPQLLSKYVIPCIDILKRNKISYLLEFSGRRGIHIWIIFDTIITKNQAYNIVSSIKKQIMTQTNDDPLYAIDIFPKTAGGKNKYGSMVKCPLSYHRKGAQSYLISDIDDLKELNEKNQIVNLQSQLAILEKYTRNNYYEICEVLNIEEDFSELKIPIFKKQYLFKIGEEQKNLNLDVLEEACKDSSVISRIFRNAKEGCLTYLDRIILVSTFSSFNEEFLRSLFVLQQNYNSQKTQEYINKYKARLYPVTMKYLYDRYSAELEEKIDPYSSILEYICEKLGIPASSIKNILPQNESPNELDKIKNIIAKETSYMRYNDEVLDIIDLYKITNFKNYDLTQIKNIFNKIVNSETELEVHEFKKYERFEAEGKEPRVLVSLSPYDRIITTYLIFELSSMANWRFDSFSYNINLLPHGDVFFPWLHSWKKFNSCITMYIKSSLYDDFNIVKVDIEKFYDNIYFHSYYKEILAEIKLRNANFTSYDESKFENIFKSLCRFNENIMLELTGSIKGVPQGPAYARVMAEILLSNILLSFKKKYPELIIFRYVDDMFLLHRDSITSSTLINDLDFALMSKGLKLNSHKTKIHGKISGMSEKDKKVICNSFNSNYLIKSVKGLELESQENYEEKIELFEKFIYDNNDWTRDANFILNEYIEDKYIEIYLEKYFKDIIISVKGRGSIFSKLYKYICTNTVWFNRLLREELYKYIPTNSINMKCFLIAIYDLLEQNSIHGEHVFFEQLISYFKEYSCNDSQVKNIILMIVSKWELLNERRI